MISEIFEVATEFRFDIGQAVLASDTLQTKVEGIAQAADNALLSFQHLGMGIVGHLGLGAGGALGLLEKAVHISDKFNNSALSFANVIGSNMKFLSGDIGSFNDRLETSKAILEDVNKVANQFALPSSGLLQMTKLIAPVLVPHGMAGTNFKNAIDMAKNVLKSAPNLGINPQDSEGQLLRAIGGQASMGDTLFRRLMSETGAFRDAHIKNSSQFNSLPFEKRFLVFQKALSQFSSDTDVLTNRVNSLSGQMTLLSNNVTEFGSVLRPLGDAFLKPIIMGLKGVNQFIENEGKAVVKSLSAMVANLLEDPRKLLINLLQLKELGRDLKHGSHTLEITGILLLVKHIPFVGKFVQALGGIAKELALTGLHFAKMLPWMAMFRGLAMGLWFVLSKLFVPLAAAVTLFQILSRAQAIAKINDAKAIAQLMPRFMDLMVRFKTALENIFMPLTIVFDTLAEWIAPLFEINTYGGPALSLFEKLVEVMEFFGKVSILAMAGFQGVVFAILQFIDNIRAGKFMNLGAGVGDAFNAGVDDVIEKNAKRLGLEGGATVNQVTNIGKVEIRNDFKEQQEPDRIAFTLKDQLLKAAKNPTQGRGTGLQNGFAR
jgi:hypothetical protein